MAVYMATQRFLRIIQVNAPQIIEANYLVELTEYFIIFPYYIITCRIGVASIQAYPYT